jgi:hypothetical protein
MNATRIVLTALTLTLAALSPGFAQEAPTEASLTYEILIPEPGYEVTYSLTRSGDKILLHHVERNWRTETTVDASYPLSLEEFERVWVLVEGLATFRPQLQEGGAEVMDYSMTTITTQVGEDEPRRVSWGQPLTNEEGPDRLQEALTALVNRHAEPAVLPNIAHVEVGQRYVYRVINPDGQRSQVILTVLEVNRASVRYSTQTFDAAGEPVDEAREEWWTCQALGELLSMGSPGEECTVAGVTFQTHVISLPDLSATFALRGGVATFPNMVRSSESLEGTAELIEIRAPN